MRVFVILYQDLWLNTCKVSQEGYTTLEQAQRFCKERLGIVPEKSNPAIYISQSPDGKYVFGNGVTQEKYTIVEVTI